MLAAQRWSMAVLQTVTEIRALLGDHYPLINLQSL